MSNNNRTRRRGGHEPSARRPAARQRNSGAPSNAQLRRDHRRPLPGNTARPHRIREALYDLYVLELKRNRKRGRKLAPRQLVLLAAAQLQLLQSRFRGFLTEYKRLAPTSRSPVGWKVKRWVEVRAFLQLPEVQWLRHHLLETEVAQPQAPRGRRPGRPSDNRYLWAMLWLLVCGRQTKDLFALHEELESAGPIKRWALGAYQLPKLKAVYDAMLSLLGRHDPRAVWHVNIALLRRLATLKDERGRPLHPELFVYLLGDGKLIESDLPQRPYKGSHHRRAVNGKRRVRVTYLVYVNQLGQVTRAVAGYKLMLLVCQQSTLPVIGGLFPATYDERQAALELIAELRSIWPWAPVTWFGGDALYDRSKRFYYELEFVHGIHPIAQPYNKFSAASPWHETKGAPKCKHGWMHRAKARFVYDTPWRLRHGQPLSAPVNTGAVMDGRKRATDRAYIEWTCRRSLCKPVTTKMRDDIRLYQFAPRDGDSALARFRQAFLVRRSAVETVFAMLGYFGVGDKAQRRMKWGGDIDMEWVLALACLFMTGRRLVHEMGLYTKAYEEAIAKGLLPRPPWGTDSPWPEDKTEGDGAFEPLPQAGVAGVGPADRRTRGERHGGVSGTMRVPRRRRGRPRSVRRARQLGSTDLGLLVARNYGHDAAHGRTRTDNSNAQTSSRRRTVPADAHWAVSLDQVVCDGGVAEPVSWRAYDRRRDAAEAAAGAQEPQRPPVRPTGGQEPPPGTAFVDHTARRELLEHLGAFEFDLLAELDDILDEDQRNPDAPTHDDLVWVGGGQGSDLAEDNTPDDWLDQPIDADDMDEDDYIERFQNIDIDRVLERFQLGQTDKAFAVNNNGKALKLAADFGLDEDLDNPTLDDEHEWSKAAEQEDNERRPRLASTAGPTAPSSTSASDVEHPRATSTIDEDATDASE